MACSYDKEPSESIEALYSLSCVPRRCVKKYTGCIVNGVQFLTKECGIVVEENHNAETIDFDGELIDIIQIDYVNDKHIILFKCNWFDLGKRKTGVKKEGNIVSVKITRRWYQNDPYILAQQAKQIFYIDDPKLGIYQENEVDSIEIKEDELHLLLRVDVDPEDIKSLLISKLPEGDEDDNFVDDVETDDLDDTLVDYVNNDDIQNTLNDDDDDDFDV
ncbi:uncharacterized protein LOC131171140 [Hevea brasiliensis]|uniref:uncharacterized protein LOC131171140 n=1 Tax=Hevea brasiliensis TaxID=3981 RepID=UPI0025DD0F99|nr:uncharacterized protein LOC131171140 [Hevea brasiliensis]